ncbi:hypothetical protein B0H16DRAFT_1375260 [Mycena metata]|uniref:F-box domain-containing protein n=1 Tax=Mycena metata TaxID=1033252 RepID=A0AAD7N6S4_9AGAR|nr:hypothetical protein B0H16DRAFT_1375260 [Mycena metata]
MSSSKVCVHCGLLPFQTSAHSTLPRAQLRFRLAQLTDLIAKLTTEQRQLRAISDSIVYPVLSIPPEITALIFFHCISPSNPFPQPSPLKAPLLLAQICREWRDIALSTPRLWQSLGLVDTRSVDVFETWLARSGNLPLNFSLNCVDPERASFLVDVCIPHAQRWQNVELALPVGLLTRLEGPLPIPLLRRISLSLRGPFKREVANGSPDDPISLRNAPSLREADVSTYPDLRFNLPWVQLTTLTLSKVDVDECFVILGLCPDLIALDITTIGPPPPPNHSNGPLTLPFLGSFTFATDFCAAADRLRLPKLTHVHIRETVGADVTHATSLQKLITLSACPIQRLALTLKYPASDTFSRMIDAMPASLHAMEVHCGNATHVAPLLTALQKPDLVSALTSLSISGGRVFDDDYDAFPALLEARAGGALREFSLLVQTYGRADAVRDVPLRMRALPRMQALAASGMKIRLAIAGRFRVGTETEVLLDTLN